MPVKKHHADCSPCPIAQALDLVGDHWTLLVVRDLMVKGRHEFKAMMASPEGISSNILSNRLRLLVDAGLVDWFPHPDNAKRKVYYLTTTGKGLVHILVATFMWGQTLETAATASAKQRDQRARNILKNLASWEKENLPA